MKTKRKKILLTVIISFLLILLAAAVYFFQFTGYPLPFPGSPAMMNATQAADAVR